MTRSSLGLPKCARRSSTSSMSPISFPKEIRGWLVGLAEIAGGLALIAGVFVAAASVVLIVDMLVAMFTVHAPHGFNFVNITGMGKQGPVFGMPGAEVNLLYIAGLLALVIG